MNYPGEGFGNPVVLGARPARNRGRLSSDHRQQVYVDVNGYLYPASGQGQGLQRAVSSSGNDRRSGTQIFIDNNNSNKNQPEEHSPVRSRPRSAHIIYDSDEWSPTRGERRHRSKVRHGHRHESKSPSPSPEIQAQLRRLHDLEEKEREEEQRRRYEEEQRLKRLAEKEKKEKEEQLMEAAIKAHNAKELEKADKERRQKEEAEKAFRERVKTVFGKAGYSDESIERILENKGKADRGGHEGQKKIMDLARPTYIKVHRKHLSPDTLDAYDLPWELDDVRPCLFLFVHRYVLQPTPLIV